MDNDPKATMLHYVAEHTRNMRERRDARDIAIRGARVEGASLREIGAVAGLTAAGVKHIVDREDPPDVAAIFDRDQLEPIGTKYQHWTAAGGFDDTSRTRVLEMLDIDEEEWWVVAIRLQNLEGLGLIDVYAVSRDVIDATIHAAATTGEIDVALVGSVETELWHNTEPPHFDGGAPEPYDLLRHGFKRMDVLLLAHRLAELGPAIRVTRRLADRD